MEWTKQNNIEFSMVCDFQMLQNHVFYNEFCAITVLMEESNDSVVACVTDIINQLMSLYTESSECVVVCFCCSFYYSSHVGKQRWGYNSY